MLKQGAAFTEDAADQGAGRAARRRKAVQRASGILVPFDGSPPALRALEHAIATARTTHAAVHLLNVQPRGEFYTSVRGLVSAAKYRRTARARAEKILRPALLRLRASKVNSRSEIGYGDVPLAIVHAAKKRKCEAITMGTQGTGALSGFLLGSVAMRVLHLATVPVTFVK